MTQPVALDQRLRLRRWMVAVGLTVAAEDAARVDTPETNAMALLGAHAGCEALLGLLAGVRPYRRAEDVTFAKLLRSAAATVPLDSGLTDDLEAMHRMRNDFVHASNTVHGDETARAISCARRLMDLVPPSLGASWVLPAGAGIGTAVAEIIEVEAVGMWLRHAEIMGLEGKPELAADGLARALDGALRRTHPRLLPIDDSMMQTVTSLRRISAGLGIDRDAERTAAKIEGLHRWVLPLALGVSPAAYDRVRDVIGHVPPYDVGGAPGPVSRKSAVAVTEDDLRRTTSATADIIFRLWAMGSLRPGPDDGKIVESAQAFIANPSGWAAGERPARSATRMTPPP